MQPFRDWLQCRWWDWKVYTANVTEQWAQIAVVGPKGPAGAGAAGRDGPFPEALPFMGWAEGEILGIPGPRLSHQLR